MGERALLPAQGWGRGPGGWGGSLTGPLSRSLVQEDHLNLQTVHVESHLMDSNLELGPEDRGLVALPMEPALGLEDPALCPPLPE